MKIGSTEISNIKIGSTSINRVIKDGVIYWEVTTTTISPTTTATPTTTGSSSWTPESDVALMAKLSFWGKVSEITGGHMPNKVTGATDYLTVAGSPSTYQVPQTVAYKDADTDYIWIQSDGTTWRTVTTLSLVAFDFPRTWIKYGNLSPYDIDEIIIPKAGETFTTEEMNHIRDYMNLSIWWSGVLSFHGSTKGNRSTQQNVWSSPLVVTGLTSQFVIDTILGQLDWVDNCAGEAEYEIYSNTNGAGRVLLSTTEAGAVTYNDTTCKQNASVVYSVRTNLEGNLSAYVDATALATPLCWKTNQSTLTQVKIDVLYLPVGKTVVVNWGDGVSENIPGSGISNKTHDYASTGQYNISLSGDVDFITTFNHLNQVKSYGVITNWLIPSSCIDFRINQNTFTGTITNWVLPSVISVFDINRNSGLIGDISSWVLPSSITVFSVYMSGLTGKIPEITAGATTLYMRYYAGGFTGSNMTVFKKAMTSIDVKDSIWSVAEVNAFLLAAANYYQANAPTSNCTFAMSGASMGIPTGGNYNVDKIRLEGYYTAAGYTATVTVNVYSMLLTKTGDGTGVSTLKIQVSADVILSLGANAKFYSDAGGTADESATWTVTSGAERTRYIKCTTGTATMTFSDVPFVTRIAEWTSGTNAASLSGTLVTFTNLTYISVLGANVLTGSIAALTALTYINVGGSTTISGSVAALTSLTYLSSTSTLLTGSIAALTSLTTLNVVGSNWSGSIAGLTSLTYLSVTGTNTISGSIAALTSLTYVYIAGASSITGSLAALTALTYLYIAGNACSISGNISAIVSDLTECYIPISYKIDYTAGATWGNTRVTITPQNSRGCTATEVDNMLIDMAASVALISKVITLKGSCAARTSASDAAVATLTGAGRTNTVTTN